MTDIVIDRATRTVLAVGAFPTPPANAGHEVVELRPENEPALRQRGLKTMAPDGTITVVLPSSVVAESQAETARTQRYAADVAALTALVPKLRPGSASVLTPDDLRLIGRAVAWLVAREAL